MSTRIALIALGSNQPTEHGDPKATLIAALARLEAEPLRRVRSSDWWRTRAAPPGSGPDFVNAAVAVETALEPPRLLAALHQIEAAFGRARPPGAPRWGPRGLDLDLIGVDDLVTPNPETARRWMALAPEAARAAPPDRLVLPHPRMQERAFVLEPLAQIAPDWRHPLLGAPVRALLAALPPGASGPEVAWVDGAPG